MTVGIPNLVTAIDGSHFRIQRPKENAELYYDKDKQHSLNVQFTVDPFKYISDVYCGCPGSWHDSRMFRRSAVYTQMQEGTILDGPLLYFNGRPIP